MAGQVLDELVTIIRYNTSNRELRRAEQQVNDFTRNTQKRFQSWGQTISKITRAATVVIGALGAGAFNVGAAEERSFLNLQTQLDDTEEKMNELKDVAKGVSKETNRPLKDLGDAIFAIRSGGQKGAAGLDILNQSAKAAAAGLGKTRPIGLLAASAVNAYGEAALSGSDAVDKLLAIVQSGNIEASTLAEPMTKLLSIGPGLGVTFDELGASVAAYTQLIGNASQAVTGVQQALSALQKPTGEAEVFFTNAYGSIQNMHKAIREDGFLNVLQRLHESVDGDAVAMGRMFSSVEALGFVTDVTTLRTEKYTEALDNITNSVGKVNKGFDIYANSSVAQADEASNNLRLALSSLYNNVLAPLLQLFGKLPSAIQTIVLGMGAMQIASTIGLGPSVGGLVTSLGRFIVALKTGTIWQSKFVRDLKTSTMAVRTFALRLWTNAKTALTNFATSIRTTVIPALARFATTIWASTIGALRALGRRLAMASLAMLRFATRAIVAGIAGVVAFAASIWTGAVPALAAFAAGVWATTVAMLANPLTWIVLGIVALIAAVVLAVKHWDKIKAVAVGAIDAIRGAVQWAWNWIKGNWPLLVGILLGPFGIVGALIWKFRDQILGVFRKVWDWLRESPIFGPVIDGIQAIIDFVRELPGRVVGILKDIPGMIADAIRDIPGLGTAINVLTGAAGKVGKALGFAEGGIVPGPLGRPLLATVHGGEMVLPVGASNVLAQMLEGFRLGPAALPQAPHYYGQMYRSSVTNRTVNINITEPIVIQTQATDAQGIAQEIGEAFEDKIRNIAYDHDGPVER